MLGSVQWKENSTLGLRNNNCNVTMLNYGLRIISCILSFYVSLMRMFDKDCFL